MTASLSPSRCSAVICSGSIANTERPRSMSARITVSVTPDFANATTWSTVIADAARGARRRTLKQPSITTLRIIAPMLRLFATIRPVAGRSNPKETKGYAIGRVDSDQDTFHAEGTVPQPSRSGNLLFPTDLREAGRFRRRVHRLPLDRLVQGVLE